MANVYLVGLLSSLNKLTNGHKCREGRVYNYDENSNFPVTLQTEEAQAWKLHVLYVCLSTYLLPFSSEHYQLRYLCWLHRFHFTT